MSENLEKVLITGGAGFIGHHMIEHFLKKTNWDIIVLDSLNYAGNLNRITNMEIYDKEKGRIRFVWHDLKSPISNTINSQIGKFDYIVHLAAETHVDRSLEDSIPFVLSNVLGTANLLEWIKNRHRDKRIIIFSTDEVFGPAPENYSFKEQDPLKPSNPYAATKCGQESLAYSFAHAWDLDLIITRCMNVFGERQHPEKFIPKTIKKILNDEKVTLHGTSRENVSSRYWIHARSVADAILFLLKNGNKKEYYHIVGEEKSVYEIANFLNLFLKKRELSDAQIEYIDFHKARPGHDKRYALNGEKLFKLGWNLPMTVEQSLKTTASWYLRSKENLKWLE